MTDTQGSGADSFDALTAERALPSPGRPRDDSPSAVTPPDGPDGPEGGVMSLVDHLAELRRRVAVSLVAIAIGGVVGFSFAPQIITLLAAPLPTNPTGSKVIFLTLSGGFLLYFRVAIVVGILIGLPVVLYELWAFVAPGLTATERRAALPWIPFAILFFLLGTVVAYVTLPFAVAFLTSFQIAGTATNFTSAEAYYGFVTTIFVVFGAVMEFPIALVLLARLGLVNRDRLRASRRYVLLGIVIFAVVITPGGDPISPLVMSAVMYVLYEFTIFMLGRGGPRTEEVEGG